MQPSIEKLLKFFKLEADRGYDNRAIVGGLEKILPNWEAEARTNSIPEEAIQLVRSRIGEYSTAPEKREAALKEVWAFIGNWNV
jgi:ATP-dependent DNA helicase RecG